MITALIIMIFFIGVAAIVLSVDDDPFWKVIGIIFILVAGLNWGAELSSDYKEGQIDALTGKIQYELKKQPDGSTIWEKKG